jgi:hypothetical protein
MNTRTPAAFAALLVVGLLCATPASAVYVYASNVGTQYIQGDPIGVSTDAATGQALAVSLWTWKVTINISPVDLNKCGDVCLNYAYAQAQAPALIRASANPPCGPPMDATQRDALATLLQNRLHFEPPTVTQSTTCGPKDGPGQGQSQGLFFNYVFKVYSILQGGPGTLPTIPDYGTFSSNFQCNAYKADWLAPWQHNMRLTGTLDTVVLQA